MELLEGKDLGAHLVERGRLDPMEVVTLVVQVGKALSKAHKASIVHRDIKPENIFLCDTEGGEVFVKLLDFGTARRDVETTSRTTVPGQIMGTPHYMSPEQSVGASEIDERSDIWSLGVVAFEAFTGQKPFDGPSVGAITIAIHGPLPKMTDIVPELPAALDAWFARTCAQLPQDRFATVKDATNALVEAVTGCAPVEQATESVHFPPAAAKGNSTPVAPVTRPIEPLIATLPERGAEKRFTTIAAGIVVAAAVAAMIAIVVGRSPAPAEPAPAEVPRSSVATEPAPPAPAAEPSATAAAAREPAAASSVSPGRIATTTDEKKTPVAMPVAPAATGRSAESAREARAKATKGPQRSTRPASSAKEGPDDDLVRLSNAAAKHAESASAATSTPTSAPPLPSAPEARPDGAGPTRTAEPRPALPPSEPPSFPPLPPVGE